MATPGQEGGEDADTGRARRRGVVGRGWRWMSRPWLFPIAAASLACNVWLVTEQASWRTPLARWVMWRLNRMPLPGLRLTDISLVRERAGDTQSQRVLDASHDSADEYTRVLRTRPGDALRITFGTTEDNTGVWALWSTQKRRWVHLRPWDASAAWSEAELKAGRLLAEEYLTRMGYVPPALKSGGGGAGASATGSEFGDVVSPLRRYPWAAALDVWGAGSAVVVVTSGSAAGLGAWRWGRARLEGSDRRRRGLCVGCGYELKGTPRDEGGGVRCPECGRREVGLE